VQMYLVLPFLYVAASRVRSHLGAMALIVSGFIVWYVDSHGGRLFGYQPLLAYAPWFFMGITAFALYQFVTPRWSAWLFGACLLLLVISPSLTHRFMGDDYRVGWVTWACGVAFALALPHFLEVKSVLIGRWTHAIATYSYGIYLSHVPIMWFAFQQLSEHSRFAQVSVFAVLIASVPPLLYYAVERPLIRLGGQISDRLAQPQRQAASTSLA